MSESNSFQSSPLQVRNIDTAAQFGGFACKDGLAGWFVREESIEVYKKELFGLTFIRSLVFFIQASI
jgi:hypothetical protein